MLATLDRRDRLDAAITTMAADSAFTPVVTRLGCLRGVSTLTAFGLATEIGDWHRFTGRTHRRLPGIGAHRVLLGGVPHAGRDDQDRQRPCPPAVGRGGLASPQPLPARGRSAAALGCRRPRPPGPAAKQANRRLHQRWERFDDRKKRPVVANAAIARELAGWCWSLAVLDD